MHQKIRHMILMKSIFLSYFILPFLHAQEPIHNVRTSYVTIPIKGENNGQSIAGKLNYPTQNHNGAAVVIVHGSSGIDSRGLLHSQALNRLGFTTLELDLWARRGWLASKKGRPKTVTETLPDAFSALTFLSNLPEIDKNKIALMGFSWGGAVTMLSRDKALSKPYHSELSFAAHLAFYPVCWAYNKVPIYKITETTGKPLLILTGELDDYDQPTSCQLWKNSLAVNEQKSINITVYKNATHGFNGTEPEKIVTDPFSHLGRGGNVIIKENILARKASIKAVNEFFSKWLLSGDN
ncbi:dienelactone hydrolase family protein [Colwelliaceae bacterium 6441]